MEKQLKEIWEEIGGKVKDLSKDVMSTTINALDGYSKQDVSDLLDKLLETIKRGKSTIDMEFIEKEFERLKSVL